MPSVEVFMWAVAVASLVGTIANIYQRKWCFIVWAFGNIAWTIYDVHKEAYSQAALMAVYAILAVYGYQHWGKSKLHKDTSNVSHAKTTTVRRKCRHSRVKGKR